MLPVLDALLSGQVHSSIDVARYYITNLWSYKAIFNLVSSPVETERMPQHADIAFH